MTGCVGILFVFVRLLFYGSVIDSAISDTSVICVVTGIFTVVSWRH